MQDNKRNSKAELEHFSSLFFIFYLLFFIIYHLVLLVLCTCQTINIIYIDFKVCTQVKMCQNTHFKVKSSWKIFTHEWTLIYKNSINKTNMITGNSFLRKHVISFTSMNKNMYTKTTKSSKSVSTYFTYIFTINSMNSWMFFKICNSVGWIWTFSTIVFKQSKSFFMVPHPMFRQSYLWCKPFITTATSKSRNTTCRKLMSVNRFH